MLCLEIKMESSQALNVLANAAHVQVVNAAIAHVVEVVVQVVAEQVKLLL